jgi:hypothetical protein
MSFRGGARLEFFRQLVPALKGVAYDRNRLAECALRLGHRVIVEWAGRIPPGGFEALEVGDYLPVVMAWAHICKGNWSCISPRVSTLFGEIERAAQAGDFPTVRERVPSLVPYEERLFEEVRAWLALQTPLLIPLREFPTRDSEGHTHYLSVWQEVENVASLDAPGVEPAGPERIFTSDRRPVNQVGPGEFEVVGTGLRLYGTDRPLPPPSISP